MPDLSFQVEGIAAVPHAVAPTLAIKLGITNGDPDETIHSISLRCQIQIETTKRHYEAIEQAKLVDLYGEPERWSQTLRSLLWTHVSAIVPPFAGATTIDLQVPCTFDFNVAVTKYLAGLEQGDIPLCLLFSGTAFYQNESGALQATQIPWDREAYYRLPLGTWREMIDLYYPNTAWLCLSRDVFDRVNEFKMRNSIPTWEKALERLLATSDEMELEKQVYR